VALSNQQRQTSAAIAKALIVALLVCGLPQLSGVIVTATHGAPAFTLDICYPLPGLNQGSGFFPVPLVDNLLSVARPSRCGTADDPPASPLMSASEAPDPPPPKPLA
jgi:hypothetical protein